jgi:hypothetical protein
MQLYATCDISGPGWPGVCDPVWYPDPVAVTAAMKSITETIALESC